MEPGEQKQVSEVALVSSQPAPRRAGNKVFFLILLGLIVASTVGALFWIDSQKKKVDLDREAQWPHDVPPDYYQTPEADYDKAVAHMEMLADALRKYHDGPMGDGLRWPASVDELRNAGMLDADYDATGMLSGREIVYQPEKPIRLDPERWVMCYDVEIGWMRSPNGFRVKGPRAAVVILGDGTVKLLKDDELENYAGLNLQVDASG